MPVTVLRAVRCTTHRRAPQPGCPYCQTGFTITTRLAHEQRRCGGWTRCEWCEGPWHAVRRYAGIIVQHAAVTDEGHGTFRARNGALPKISGTGTSPDGALSALREAAIRLIMRAWEDETALPVMDGFDISARFAAIRAREAAA